MSKITVITDAKGNIVAMGLGQLSEQTARQSGSHGPKAGLRAGPGQQLHEIDVPEALENIKTWSELHGKVAPYIKRS